MKGYEQFLGMYHDELNKLLMTDISTEILESEFLTKYEIVRQLLDNEYVSIKETRNKQMKVSCCPYEDESQLERKEWIYNTPLYYCLICLNSYFDDMIKEKETDFCIF